MISDALFLFERNDTMICHYNDSIAIYCGINSALISSYLWDEAQKHGKIIHGKNWYRCAQKRMTAIYPFLGRYAVSSAIKRLENAGIIVRAEHNASAFDRTLSYSFTSYGQALMEEQNG